MSAAPEHIESLESLHGRYDALLCDVWGVIHNGERLYLGAGAALRAFRAQGGAVLLVSNAPRPRAPIFFQLDRLWLPRDAYDGIVTSGDATRLEMAARAPGPVMMIGPQMDEELWANLGLLSARGIADAEFIAISGLNNPDKEKPSDYIPILEEAKARGLELVCANPDIQVRIGDNLVWCAGAVAAEYAKLGGDVIMSGKPHPAIYKLAVAELERILGRTPDPSRILCVGDGVATDMKGANAHGFDALFIASGMHGEALRTAGTVDAEKVRAVLSAEGVSARYVMSGLA